MDLDVSKCFKLHPLCRISELFPFKFSFVSLISMVDILLVF